MILIQLSLARSPFVGHSLSRFVGRPLFVVVVFFVCLFVCLLVCLSLVYLFPTLEHLVAIEHVWAQSPDVWPLSGGSLCRIRSDAAISSNPLAFRASRRTAKSSLLGYVDAGCCLNPAYVSCRIS